MWSTNCDSGIQKAYNLTSLFASKVLPLYPNDIPFTCASTDMARSPKEPASTALSEKSSSRIAWKVLFEKMTPVLFVSWMITAQINIIFGYETTSFSGVQSMPSFAKEFGSQDSSGKWALSAARASYTSSTAFAGKLIGSLVYGFVQNIFR